MRHIFFSLLFDKKKRLSYRVTTLKGGDPMSECSFKKLASEVAER